jgi:hypothetical protein
MSRFFFSQISVGSNLFVFGIKDFLQKWRRWNIEEVNGRTWRSIVKGKDKLREGKRRIERKR